MWFSHNLEFLTVLPNVRHGKTEGLLHMLFRTISNLFLPIRLSAGRTEEMSKQNLLQYALRSTAYANLIFDWEKQFQDLDLLTCSTLPASKLASFSH